MAVNAMKMTTAAEDTLKIIGTLLVIAVIYCLVEVVRYWQRRDTHTYQKSHPRHLNERECKSWDAAIEDILKHEEALFKQPPPNEDCPICFLTLPSLKTGRKYKTCCGKIICSGCIHAVQMIDGDAKCPFCRVPSPISEEEIIERYKKRMEMDDANAISDLGVCYYHGLHGVPQDNTKALELWHRAGELGSAESYYNIGCAYEDSGEGVEKDMKKAMYYWELAAMGGDVGGRYNLGLLEKKTGNMVRALKHYIIAVECGDNESLMEIREFYMNGHATKDEYTKALRAYQKYLDGIKSDQRDEAAAFNECCRYH